MESRPQLKINWAIGFRRLWIVLSLAWVTYVIWSDFTYLSVVISHTADFSSGVSDLKDELTLAFAPPLLVATIGYGIYWSIRGFKSGQEKEMLAKFSDAFEKGEFDTQIQDLEVKRDEALKRLTSSARKPRATKS